MKKKNFFNKFNDQDIIIKFNYIAVVFLAVLVILVLLFLQNIVSLYYVAVLFYISVLSVATANVNCSVLPYQKRQPSLVFVAKSLVLKHLFYTLKKCRLLQLFLTIFLIIIAMFVLRQPVIILITLLSIIASYLAEIIFGFFKLITKLLFLVQMWYVMTGMLTVALIINIVQLLLIFVYISNYQRINSSNFVFLARNKKYRSSGNVFYLLLIYMYTNKVFSLLIGGLVIFLAYICQYIFLKMQLFLNFQTGQSLPIMIVLLINFLALLEFLVGNKSEENLIDKARVETLYSSSIVSVRKIFTASYIYLITSLIFVVASLSLIGVFLKAGSMVTVWQNILLTFFLYFIGFVYFRKMQLIITGLANKILRFTFNLLILIVCIVSIFVSVMFR